MSISNVKKAKKWGSFSTLAVHHMDVMEAFAYQKEQEKAAEQKSLQGSFGQAQERILALESANPGVLRDVYRKIINSNQIQIFLQEKVSLQNAESKGFETLVRPPKFEQLDTSNWTEAQRKMGKEILSLNTEQFCNMAKAASMSKGLDCYIVYNTMRVVKENPLQKDQVISINVHPDNIANRSFANWVQSSLQEHGISGSAIRMEVVESDRECSLEQLRKGCERLKDRGVALSIDDYCTGASHPAYLHYVPAEELKIPRPFLLMYDDPAMHERAKKWITSMVEQGKEKGMKITVEGVETAEHVRFLRDIGVDCAQGYYFSKPMAAQDAIACMKEKQEIEHPASHHKKLSEAVMPKAMVARLEPKEEMSETSYQKKSGDGILGMLDLKAKRALREADAIVVEEPKVAKILAIH